MSNTDTEVKSVVAINHQAHAQAIAEKAYKDKGFTAILEKQVALAEEVAQSVIVVLSDLQRVYGDTLPEFPVPDSEGGNNPDVYKVEYTKNDGKPGTKNSSFYRDFYLATMPGRVANTHREQLAEALKREPDVTKITNAEIKQRLDDGDKRWLTAEAKKWGKRAQAGESLIKRAARLHYAMENILSIHSDKTPIDIEYESYTDEKGNVQLTRTQYPIVISGDLKKGQFQGYTVSQVIKLGDADNVAVVKQKGGGYPTLIASLRKGTQSDETKKGSSIVTIDQMKKAVNDLASFLDVNDNEGRERYNAVLAQMAKKGGEETVLAIGDLYMVLKDLYAPMQARYERLNENRASETADLNVKKETAAA